MNGLQKYLDTLPRNNEQILDVLLCYNDESACFLNNHEENIAFVIRCNNAQNKRTTILDTGDIEKEINRVMSDDNYYGGHKEFMNNSFQKMLYKLSKKVDEIKDVLICYNEESRCFLVNKKGDISFVIKYNNEDIIFEDIIIKDRGDIENEVNRVMRNDNYYGGHKENMIKAIFKINEMSPPSYSIS